MKGPTSWKNEVGVNSNVSRNYLFELYLGSIFRFNKRSVIFNGDSDFILEYKNEEILCECKRLKSKKKIIKEIKDVCKKNNKTGKAYSIFIDVTPMISTEAFFCANQSEGRQNFIKSFPAQAILDKLKDTPDRLKVICFMYNYIHFDPTTHIINVPYEILFSFFDGDIQYKNFIKDSFRFTSIK